MRALGVVALAIEDSSIDVMERTHELHVTLGAPDLEEGFLSEQESGKAFPATHSAEHALALGEATRQAARRSLTLFKPNGFCRKGHAMTPENKIGRHCRICKNQWKRDRRKLGLAA